MVHDCFYSKKVEPANTRYHTLDKELFASTWGLQNWNQYLEDLQFHILTNLKLLTSFQYTIRSSFTLSISSPRLYLTVYLHHSSHSWLIQCSLTLILELKPMTFGLVSYLRKAQAVDQQTQSLQLSPSNLLDNPSNSTRQLK